MPTSASMLPTGKAHYKYDWEAVSTACPFPFLLHYSCFVNRDRDTSNSQEAAMQGGDHWLF